MIETLARLGYAAIALVYAIVGSLAIAGALGKRSAETDQRDAFAVILGQPFGRVLLAAIAISLAGYVVWRIASGITDSEHRGNDAKGIALRLGSIGRGLIYGGIAMEVVRLILRKPSQSGGSETAAKHWTTRLLEMPFGRWLGVIAGLCVIGYGAYQLYAGIKGKLSRQLGALGDAAKSISRFGLAARGVVFLAIGGSIALAAYRYDPNKAHGTAGAMRLLAEPANGKLLVVIGAGLIAYGVYALINARYRRISAT